MSHRLIVLPTAEADIDQIADWIVDNADVETALRYIARIRARIDKLRDYTRQGAVRSVMGAEGRTVSFERRIIIAYLIEGEDVIVARVVSAQRDLSDLTL